MARPIQFLIRVLQFIGERRSSRAPHHLNLGSRGEIEAYLYLQKLGYRFVATNFRVPHNRGEIDLIGWDNDILCFVEVKTRTDASFAPPSAAVTREKQQHILSVARRYLRRQRGEYPPCCRFDVVSVVAAQPGSAPEITLRKGAFAWKTSGTRERGYWSFAKKRLWRR